MLMMPKDRRGDVQDSNNKGNHNPLGPILPSCRRLPFGFAHQTPIWRRLFVPCVVVSCLVCFLSRGRVGGHWSVQYVAGTVK